MKFIDRKAILTGSVHQFKPKGFCMLEQPFNMITVPIYFAVEFRHHLLPLVVWTAISITFTHQTAIHSLRALSQRISVFLACVFHLRLVSLPHFLVVVLAAQHIDFPLTLFRNKWRWSVLLDVYHWVLLLARLAFHWSQIQRCDVLNRLFNLCLNLTNLLLCNVRRPWQIIFFLKITNYHRRH